MMASPSELSLECKHHSYSMLLRSFGEQSDQTQKLEEFLARLEEERLKIDAFKRELPLCMQLLTNAVEAYRQQLQSYRANNQGAIPVLEEFIPIKHGSSDQLRSENLSANNIISADKANWMTSAQLWSQSSDHETKENPSVLDAGAGIGIDIISPKKIALADSKQRNGGAFLPFSKDRNNNSCSSQSPCFRPLIPELALVSSDKEMEEDKKKIEQLDARRESCINGGNGAVVIIEQGKGVSSASQAESQNTTISSSNNTTNTQRKARRCWSPDLHRRFVNALQMLGGSQVATPKQIRELMKVDGLTNDEVKSHLQKYRLHTRRPSPSPQAAAAAAPQLVVLGGIWVPPEYATAAAAAHGGAPATLYGAHPSTHASPHYCATQVSHQEFYPAPTPPLPPHHQLHHLGHTLHHHQLHVYNPHSQTLSSPESDARGHGGRSESIEDGKSESSSWKVDSGGENGGERKGLVIREEGEESNGSEITLKF